ncbi:hypothetical protein G6F50_017850 [Rhizopus delemar]|uniref:Secreted protein n=1 Tax=Rhizopus delemar TaxID=936053 RepID=A0A9P6XP17_9FUNG|nr:hypothetical protein G6F50_017850 [Rhizopus delemar]
MRWASGAAASCCCSCWWPLHWPGCISPSAAWSAATSRRSTARRICLKPSTPPRPIVRAAGERGCRSAGERVVPAAGRNEATDAPRLISIRATRGETPEDVCHELPRGPE